MSGALPEPVGEVLTGGDDGFELLPASEADSGAVVALYGAIPSTRRVRALVPLGNRRVTGAALAHLGAGATGVPRSLASLVVPVARLGLDRFALRQRHAVVSTLPDAVLPLERLIHDRVGNRAVFFCVRLGLHRPNGKPVVDVLDERGRSVAFIKFGWDRLTKQLVSHEAGALARLARQEVTAVRIPKVLDVGEWGDLDMVMTEPLPALAATRQSDAGAGALRQLVEALPTVEAPLGDSDFWARELARRDDVSEALDAPTRDVLDRAVTYVEAGWADRSVTLGLGHGDWIPPNMGMADGELQVWDWERSSDDVPLGVDLSHFHVYEAAHARPGRSQPETPAFLSDVAADLRILGIDPDLAPALVVMDLIDMLLRFGEALVAGRAVTGSRYRNLLERVLIDIR